MTHESQCNQVLQYMDDNGSITAREAMEAIGCGRLAARIADLKKRGFDIVSEMVTVPTRDGGVARVARYRRAEG